MTKLLITGASGELGRILSILAIRQHHVIGTYLSNSTIGAGLPLQLDLRDRDATLQTVESHKPDVIIHTACSDRSNDMERTIVLAGAHIAEAASCNNARLIVLSTDMVFDGENPPYREDSPPAPLSPYGRAKSEMEQSIREITPGGLIVRTSLIYEFSMRSRQVSWMRDALKAGNTLTLFVDEIRQPVWGPNLAAAILELAHNDLSGILNVAGPNAMSRSAYGRMLFEVMNLGPSTLVREVTSNQVSPNRPRDLSLDLTNARTMLSTRLLSIHEALRFHLALHQGHPTSTTTRR